MKPEMERLMYEILTQVFCGGEDVISLEILNQRFDANSPPKKERIRNAVSRLCGAGHLKNRGGQYIFVKPIRDEPPKVDSLFPGGYASRKKQPHSKVRKMSRDVVAIPSSKVQEDTLDNSAPLVKKVEYGSVTDWVIEKLSLSQKPISIASFYKWSTEEGITIKKHTIRQLLSDLTRQGRIVRVKRGVYAAIEGTYEFPAGRAVLRVRSVEVKSVLLNTIRDFRNVLREDIACFETLISMWKKERVINSGNTENLQACISDFQIILAQRKKTLKSLDS